MGRDRAVLFDQAGFDPLVGSRIRPRKVSALGLGQVRRCLGKGDLLCPAKGGGRTFANRRSAASLGFSGRIGAVWTSLSSGEGPVLHSIPPRSILRAWGRRHSIGSIKTERERF